MLKIIEIAMCNIRRFKCFINILYASLHIPNKSQSHPHKELTMDVPLPTRACSQFKLIFPLCRIYASVNWVSIGSDNGLSPIRCQTITQTNAGILFIGPLATHFCEILIHKNASENIVCDMAATLFRGIELNSDQHSIFFIVVVLHLDHGKSVVTRA